MEAKELRIGNYVKDYYYDTTIEVSIKTLIVIEELTKPTSEFQCPIVPIPLTEDWLVRVGFYKGAIINIYLLDVHVDRFSGLIKITPKKDNKFEFNIGLINLTSIKYIHQLQNLYYALTGQELQQ